MIFWKSATSGYLMLPMPPSLTGVFFQALFRGPDQSLTLGPLAAPIVLDEML